MSDAQNGPNKLDMSKLSTVQKMYVKRAERMNVTRAYDFNQLKSRIRYVGMALGCFVVGIYGYTMVAMKQEKLGEEFDQRYEDTISKKN